MRLLFSVFPSAPAVVERNVLVAVEGDRGTEVHVLSSREQVIAIGTKATDPQDALTLMQRIVTSGLPQADRHEPVVVRGYSAARIVNAYLQLQKMGEQPDLSCSYPALCLFDVTDSEQHREFGYLGGAPDFLGVALNRVGRPEVTVGWSRAQARQYLGARQLWNVTPEWYRELHAFVGASALPETVVKDTTFITGQAAGALLEMFLIIGPYRMSFN